MLKLVAAVWFTAAIAISTVLVYREMANLSSRVDRVIVDQTKQSNTLAEELSRIQGAMSTPREVKPKSLDAEWGLKEGGPNAIVMADKPRKFRLENGRFYCIRVTATDVQLEALTLSPGQVCVLEGTKDGMRGLMLPSKQCLMLMDEKLGAYAIPLKPGDEYKMSDTGELLETVDKGVFSDSTRPVKHPLRYQVAEKEKEEVPPAPVEEEAQPVPVESQEPNES